MNVKHGIFLSGFFVVIMELTIVFSFVFCLLLLVVFWVLFVCLFGGCIMLKQNQDLELCNDNYWNLVKHHPKQQHVFHHRP